LPDFSSFSNASESSSKEALLQAIREMEEIETELRVRKAIEDKWFWLTQCTKTKDEQDQENPYKPFPADPYLWYYLEALDYESPFFTEKSRTMMCSWATAGHTAHVMFNLPAIGVVVQSKDEDRALHFVDYVKELWANSLEPLKKRWKLSKPLEKQAYNRLELANGSWILGITGDPAKIRSEHPTIVVLDEAAFIETGENYNVSVATRCKQIIALSSAKPGWFREATEFAKPVDYPRYPELEAAGLVKRIFPRVKA
jgi:hypothetical protein